MSKSYSEVAYLKFYPIQVLAVRLTSSPALTVLVSTEINAVIDDEIVATVAMKPTVELIILLLMSK